MNRLIILIASLLSIAQAQGDGTTVQTQQGLVTGTLVSPGVRQFLGIPYAIANRWEAPQAPPSRSSTLEATSFGDSCVQLLTDLSTAGDQNVPESEECLNANIWAPSLQRKQGTAVMIWIYGGAFQSGTSNTAYYNGQNFVRDNEDVLIVTFNYRTNIFGQPNAPQLTSATQIQNFFMLDTKAIVEWVHANIATFGGDPERITLFGESAGSLIIDAYTYANPTDTMVKGVIEESGSIAGRSLEILVPAIGSTLMSWNEVANAVGCGNDTTPEQFSCMKAVPFRTLEDAVNNTGAVFAPIPDDISFFADTGARSAAGNFLRVPLLVGNNAQEADIIIFAVTEGMDLTPSQHNESDTITLIGWTCPAGITAGDRANAGVPTWRYRYEAVFPDLSLPGLGAYHTSEIPIVFGTYNSSPIPAAPTVAEIQLSKYVQGAWVAFARNPAQGLTQYGWPRYSPSMGESVAELGGSNSTGVAFSPSINFDLTCGTLDGAMG